MYKVILILDKFFLKYEEGVKLTPHPQKKLPSKSPALLGLNKSKHVLAENELNELSENAKLISTKRLDKQKIW